MNLRLAGAIGADAAALWALRPDPEALRESIGPQMAAAVERDGADAVLLTLSSGVLWLGLGWLLLALIGVGASTMPGRAGMWGQRLSRIVVPASTRRLLAVALGMGIAVGPALGVTASAASPPAAMPAPGWPLSAPEWPISPMPDAALPAPQPSPSGGPSDTPADPAEWAPEPDHAAPATPEPDRAAPATPDPDRAAPATPDPDRAAPEAPEVVVAAGDSLWSIAAAHLPGEATEAAIAAAWPAWHHANADVIGEDPNVIRPGQVLRAPDAP